MIPKQQIEAMWRDYEGGMSLSAVGRKNGRDHQSVRDLFRRRGLPVRPNKTANHCQRVGGRFVPAPMPSAAEIDAMIRQLKRVMIPPGLKSHWRHMTFAERAKLVRKMRRRLASPVDRPRKPFSRNVEPFDYTTPRAWEIAAKANAGLNSQSWRVKIKLASQGVIYQGQLWFWTSEGPHQGGYYLGPWRPETGRPGLHRVIWEERHGAVPEGMTVTLKDGNHNNLDPRNLVLRSREECALQNSIPYRLKQDPGNKDLQVREKLRTARAIEAKRQRSRATTTLLLNQHNSGQGSLAAQLK